MSTCGPSPCPRSSPISALSLAYLAASRSGRRGLWLSTAHVDPIVDISAPQKIHSPSLLNSSGGNPPTWGATDTALRASSGMHWRSSQRRPTQDAAACCGVYLQGRHLRAPHCARNAAERQAPNGDPAGPCTRTDDHARGNWSGPSRLLVYCGAHKCSHSVLIDANRWPDSLRLSDLESLLYGKVCGHRGADLRPLFAKAHVSTGA